MNKWKEGRWKFTINGTVLKILKLAGDELWEEDGTLWMKIKFLPSGSAELIDNATCNLELYWAIFQRQGHGVVTEDGHRIMLDNDIPNTIYWTTINYINTSLAAPGALAHRLQRRAACKIQNGRQWAPKWPTGSGKVSTTRFLGVLSNFR